MRRQLRGDLEGIPRVLLDLREFFSMASNRLAAFIENDEPRRRRSLPSTMFLWARIPDQ